MTRVFKNKKELAERLVAGEKWKIKGKRSCFYLDSSRLNPFRFDNGYDEAPMDSAWSKCDGKTVWEQVIDKPKTKTVWFWKIKNEIGEWYINSYMLSEEEVEHAYPGRKVKRLEALSGEEVEDES